MKKLWLHFSPCACVSRHSRAPLFQRKHKMSIKSDDVAPVWVRAVLTNKVY